MSKADEGKRIKQLTRAEINKLDMIKLREKYNELYKSYINLLNKNNQYKSLEDLGFEAIKEYDEIHYFKKCRQWREEGEIRIEINLRAKNVDIVFLGNVSGNLPAFLEPIELQAINEKVKELGWNE